MRLNGHATTDATGITIELEQVYSNCPKYIAKRHPMPRAATPSGTRRSLDNRQSACSRSGHGLHRHPRTGGSGRLAPRRPSGVPQRHKGTVSWPDFQGNALFNTLGNLVVDPACGLTVIDPEDGTTLYLSGQATVADDRRVTLKPDRVVRLTNAAPISWWLEKLGRYPSSA